MRNCLKGLKKKENVPTAKIVDVKDFLMTNDLQLLCLIEADLYGVTSRVKPITSKEIEGNLKIENYKIILPQSWQVHGKARALLHIRKYIRSMQFLSTTKPSSMAKKEGSQEAVMRSY
jgi:hypothetical protein